MFLLFANLTSFAQQNTNEVDESSKSSKVSKVLGKFSVTATAASPSFNFNKMNNATYKKAKGNFMGELGISYKLNPRISFGLSTVSSLGLCNSGYYNAEGAFVTFNYDDDGDDAKDDKDKNEPKDDDNDTDDDGNDIGFGSNIMGTFTFKISEKVPFFVQATGGFSFGSKAPAYSAMIGYNQKIFKGLGILGGFRYSDILHQKPADAVKMTPSSGIRAELGLSWNF